MSDGFCGASKWHNYDEGIVSVQTATVNMQPIILDMIAARNLRKGKNNEQKKENPTPGGKLFDLHKLHSHWRG